MIKANLTEGSVLKKLVVFAVPFLLSNLIQAAYSAVDLLIVSWYGSDADIAAVSVGSQIMVLITNVLVGLSIGITVLTALYVGGKSTKKVGKLFGTATAMFTAISVILTVVLILCSPLIVKFMNVDPKAHETAVQYFNVSFSGIIFIVIYNVIAGMYRGAGITKPALFFVLISGVLNLVLDIYFVKNLQLGAYGAAVATVISQAVACVLAIILLIIQRKNYFIELKSFKPDFSELKKIIKLGLPSAIQQFTIQISFVILMRLANSGGIAYNIAYGYVTRVSSFAILPLFSILTAVTALTGQNLGAGNPDRAVKSVWAGIAVMIPMAIIMFVCINLFSDAIYGFFLMGGKETEEMVKLGEETMKLSDAVIKLSSGFTHFMSWEYLAVVPIYALHGFVNGTGKTTFTMFNSFLSSLVVRIPLSYILYHFMGFNGIGLALSLSPLLPTIVAFIYVLSGKWKSKSGAAYG